MPSKVNEIDSATLLDEENKKFRDEKELCFAVKEKVNEFKEGWNLKLESTTTKEGRKEGRSENGKTKEFFCICLIANCQIWATKGQ